MISCLVLLTVEATVQQLIQRMPWSFGPNGFGSNYDLASIFGADSVAQAGLLEDDGFLGSNDLAAVFGSELTANALGNAITTIEPSSLAALFGL
jgi:hypothetical protein